MTKAIEYFSLLNSLPRNKSAFFQKRDKFSSSSTSRKSQPSALPLEMVCGFEREKGKKISRSTLMALRQIADTLQLEEMLQMGFSKSIEIFTEL